MGKELLKEKSILPGHVTTAKNVILRCQKKKVLTVLFNSLACQLGIGRTTGLTNFGFFLPARRELSHNEMVKKHAATKHVQERNLSETRTEAGSESVARSCPSSPIALLHPLLQNHPKSTEPSKLEYLPYICVQAKEKDDYNERLTIALTEEAQKYEHPESLLLLITSKHSASS